jgi:hypothetical protein
MTCSAPVIGESSLSQPHTSMNDDLSMYIPVSPHSGLCTITFRGRLPFKPERDRTYGPLSLQRSGDSNLSWNHT